MKGHSLELRLLAAGATAVFVALAVAWAGLNLLFQRHVELREAAFLTRIGEQLAASLSAAPDGQVNLLRKPGDPRQTRPAGGLYWQVTNTPTAVYSPSLWDQTLPTDVAAPKTQWRHRRIEGPFGTPLLVVERQIRPSQSAAYVTIQVAHDDTGIRQASAEFSRELALSLGLLWLVLSTAAFVQVKLGLKPLGRLPADMEKLRRSPAARLSSVHPKEILPLIEAINRLAEAREQDLSRARRRAADLAHSLKTPLSVLSAQSRKARVAGANDAADGLDKAISAVNAALEAELARARAAAARAATDSPQSPASEVVERLISVIERTEQGEMLVFDIAVEPDLLVPVTREDLSEILGALIENATRHAKRQVRVSGTTHPSGIELRVEDDGKGMDAASIAVALRRGARLDETGSGHGLGLSIVRDLAEATEAEIRFGRSDLGGLEAVLIWPKETQG